MRAHYVHSELIESPPDDVSSTQVMDGRPSGSGETRRSTSDAEGEMGLYPRPATRELYVEPVDRAATTQFDAH